MSLTLTHPLSLNTKVRAAVAGCACRGGKLELTEGAILKVITNQQGYWYYLSSGRTVSQNQIQAVLN
jgi:hypothetical protein